MVSFVSVGSTSAMAEKKFKENLCHLLVYSHFLMTLLTSTVCVVHMHVAVRVTGLLSISHLRDSFLVGLFRPYLIIWPLGYSLQTMNVFHSQVKMRLWSRTHSLTLNNLHTSSRYFFFPTLSLTAEKCPQKEYSSVPDLPLWLSWDSHTFQQTIEKHAFF